MGVSVRVFVGVCVGVVVRVSVGVFAGIPVGISAGVSAGVLRDDDIIICHSFAEVICMNNCQVV